MERGIDDDVEKVLVHDISGIAKRDMTGFDLEVARSMVSTGELLSAEALCKRRGIEPTQLWRDLYNKRVFSVFVDGVKYFPSFFAQPPGSIYGLDYVCRIISPTPVQTRLQFLTSPRGDLDGRRPLDCLAPGESFSRLQRVTDAWLESQFRTSIRAYLGLHSAEPDVGSAVLVAEDGCDPMDAVWARALKVVDSDGGGGGDGSETVRAATFFVSQASAQTCRELQAKVFIEVVDNTAHVRTERIAHGKTTIALAGKQNMASIARSIFDALDQPGSGPAPRL
jgi:hypothetical protein